MAEVAWGDLIIGQLGFYWDVHLWPRLAGLTDEEYLWEPVTDCWTLRPAEDGGGLRADGGWPEPSPPPVTTIAWRMTHLAIGCFAERTALFFDGPAPAVDLPGTAAEGVAYLEQTYRAWFDVISALDGEGLAQPLGAKGGPYAREPMAALIVHLNREVMHHGGEIGLMRDLYRATAADAHRLRG
ncbi:DinB family protein [Catellatospora tritici]|uniref:DinB family protein n=1 Tax=Catellatospora tritici TaxID=2851566 RepID=UPI001C2DE5A5|nr:DinB family protein [Catellatospora tritici]MBV1856049.1 DinB family protein [Catellatospora tritici]